MIVTVELPTPGLLWTRWVTLAAALSAIGFDDVWSLDDTGALYLDKLGEVETYDTIWNALDAVALSQSESDDLIGTIIKESDG